MKMNGLTPSLILLVTGVLMAPCLSALEVDREVAPRITLGGRIIATPTTELKSGYQGGVDEHSDEIDISDSGLLARFDKRLYQGGIAGAIIGFTKPESGSDLPDDVYFHQFNAFFYNQDFRLSLGRTRLRNTLIELPTLRDDDLMEYTHSPNASSFAENDPFQLFGTMASLDWFIDQKNTMLSFWVGSRAETDDKGIEKDQADYNTAGVGFVYQNSEKLRYLQWLRHAGILLDIQSVADGKIKRETTIETEEAQMISVIGGAEFNLNQNPQFNWSMGLQAIHNQGIEGSRLSDPNGLLRSAYNASVVFLRYTGRPQLLTRYQGALNIASKTYSSVPDASQYSIVPSVVSRMGQGIDLVFQVAYTHFNDGLAKITGFESEQKLQAGIIFSFDTSFNDTIGERNSILNLEHGYIE